MTDTSIVKLKQNELSSHIIVNNSVDKICWIDRLEINNFKSYRGLHIIGPFKRITGIIGPNGAGKSNLMDAIAFVLGVQARHMRGSTLSDLIYRSSLNNENMLNSGLESGIPTEASVTLFLRFRNTDSIMSFSRCIVSKGTHTVLRIDGNTVTIVEYQTKLAEFNILVKARNFLIFQGDVIEVGEKNSHEIAELFEQVSGSNLLKQDHEQLESDLKQLSMDVKYQTLQRQRVEAQRIDLEKQVNEVNEYKNLEKELLEARTVLVVYKLYLNQVLTNKTKKKLDQAALESNQFQNKKKKLTQQICDSDAFVCKLRVEKQQIEKNQNEIRNKIASYNTQIACMTESIEFGEQKQLELTKQIENNKLVEAKRQKQIYQLKNEVSAVEEMLQKLIDDNPLDNKKTPNLTKAQQEEYSNLKHKALTLTANLKVSSMAVESQNKSLKNHLKECQTEITELEIQLEAVDKNISEWTQFTHTISPQIDDATERLTALTDKRDILHKEYEAAQKRETELHNEQHELEAELTKYNAGQHETRKLQKNRETLTELHDTFPGKIFGTMADLCRPSNRKYGVAVGASLGRFTECVVVDTFTTAKKAVDLLKARKSGIFEFAALDSITHIPPDPRLRKLLQDNFRLAIDCVEFDSQFKMAFQVALHDCVIVPSLKDAQQLAYIDAPAAGISVKVITLDGEKILRNGNIVIDTAMHLSVRFGHNDVKRLNKRLDELLASKQTDSSFQQFRLKIEDYNKQISQYTSLLRERQDRLEIWRNRLIHAEKERFNISAALERRQSHAVQLEKDIQKGETISEQSKIKMLAVESEVFASFGKKVHINDLRQFEEEEKIAEYNREQKRLQYTTRQQKLEFELRQLETECSIENSKGNLTDQLQMIQTQLHNELVEVERLKEFHKQYTDKLTDFTQQIKENHPNNSIAEHTLKLHREELRALSTQLSTLQLTIEQLTLDGDRLIKEATDLIKHAILEGVPLPLSHESLQQYCQLLDLNIIEDISSYALLSEKNKQTKDTDNSFEDTSGFHFDMVLTPELKNTATQLDTSKSTEKRLEEKIGSLRAELAKKNPNMKATDKYQTTIIELKNTEKHMTQLKIDKEKKERQCVAIRKDRTKRFLNCFHSVQKIINRIYNLLTKQYHEDDCGGGQAFLELCDEGILKTPGDIFRPEILYNVIPPSKRFSNLRRLSGGEKTMAALALLFAIHSYSPSPFIILDEVDADLDPYNIMSLAEYIQDSHCQVVIISHSDRIFSQADLLLGVYIDTLQESSATLSLDLSSYEKPMQSSVAHREEHHACHDDERMLHYK